MKLEEMSVSFDYHLGRIHFTGHIGQFSGEQSIDGEENLKRILGSCNRTGEFSIVSEDSSYKDNNGLTCSGRIGSLTYYYKGSPDLHNSINLPFEEFLEKNRPQTIRKATQFSAI